MKLIDFMFYTHGSIYYSKYYSFKSQKKIRRENLIKERKKEDFTIIMAKTPQIFNLTLYILQKNLFKIFFAARLNKSTFFAITIVRGLKS